MLALSLSWFVYSSLIIKALFFSPGVLVHSKMRSVTSVASQEASDRILSRALLRLHISPGLWPWCWLSYLSTGESYSPPSSKITGGRWISIIDWKDCKDDSHCQRLLILRCISYSRDRRYAIVMKCGVTHFSHFLASFLIKLNKLEEELNDIESIPFVAIGLYLPDSVWEQF